MPSPAHPRNKRPGVERVIAIMIFILIFIIETDEYNYHNHRLRLAKRRSLAPP